MATKMKVSDIKQILSAYKDSDIICLKEDLEDADLKLLGVEEKPKMECLWCEEPIYKCYLFWCLGECYCLQSFVVFYIRR